MVTRRELLLGLGAGAVGLALGGDAGTAGSLGGQVGTPAPPSGQDLAIREDADAAATYARPVRMGDRRVIWSARPTGPHAAITFDDGPTPEFTPRILDALRGAGVSATFFVMGFNAVRRPDLLRQIVAEGHELANHTWSHLDQSAISAPEIRTEIVRCRDEVEQLVQRSLVGFRPPRGELTGSALLVAAELDYDVFLWSVTRGVPGTSTVAAVEDFISATAVAGDIIGLHDGIGRGTFQPTAPFARTIAERREVEVRALPGVLARLADRGIRLTTVTDLLARSAPAV